GAKLLQLELATVDLAVELVDQLEAPLQRQLPGLRQLQPLEQLPAAQAEEIRERTGDAVREQRRLDTVLERRPMPDEMEAEAGPLPLTAHGRVGQPDRRHQLPPAELGQHPR